MKNTINFNRIEQAIKFLTENYRQQPNLDEVAEKVNLSPFHFQRMFTDWVGITPKKFTQFLTVEHLKERLASTKNLMLAAETVGLSTQSRVYDLFVTLEAMTPYEYKTSGKGLRIEYGFHQSPFGECLIGLTDRGICGLQFIVDDDRETAFARFRTTWSNAEVIQNQELTGKELCKAFDFSGRRQRLNVLVKGTGFQVKVWNALLQIPSGGVSSYQTIAKTIGKPKALQAVGSAVGANPVAYLIPCHRVIRSEGIIGEYRWGSSKKKMILGYELSTCANNV